MRLLHRTTRKLRLTDAGATYYEECARALEVLAMAEGHVRQAQESPRGRVRMTAPHDVSHHLAPLLASFLREYPDVTLEVELSQRVTDLIAEGFDLAVRATTSLADSSLVARRIGGGEAGLFASARYLAQRGAPKRPEDLPRHRTVALGLRKQEAVWTLERRGQTVQIEHTPCLWVNDPGMARAAAAADLGIAFLPIGVQRKEDKPLVRVLPEWRIPSGGSIFVVVPSVRHQPAAVRALREHLVEHFGKLWRELERAGSAPEKPNIRKKRTRAPA